MEEKQEILEDFEEQPQPVERKNPFVDGELANGEEDNEDDEIETTEVTLDDLDDVPPAEKFRVINFKDKDVIPETLTVAEVQFGKCYPVKNDGSPNPPEKNKNGGFYYKAKLIVKVEEKINNSKIRMLIPSIFYSVNGGIVEKIPTVPKPATEKKMNDPYTPFLSKIRHKFDKHRGVEIGQTSSRDFLKGLIGMKFKPHIEEGEFDGKEFIKMYIGDFV